MGQQQKSGNFLNVNSRKKAKHLGNLHTFRNHKIEDPQKKKKKTLNPSLSMNEKTCNPLLNGWMKTHMHGEPRVEDQSEAPEHTAHPVRMKRWTATVRATKNRTVPIITIEGFLFLESKGFCFLGSNGRCF